MTTPYVARTKQARKKLRDNRTLPAPDRVRLTCGCELMRDPELVAGSQRRWWCCHGWQTAVKR